MAEYVAVLVPTLQRLLVDAGYSEGTWQRATEQAENTPAGAASRLLLLTLHVDDRMRRGDADGAAVAAYMLGEHQHRLMAMGALMQASTLKQRDAWRGKLGGNAVRVPVLDNLWATLMREVPRGGEKALRDWLLTNPQPGVTLTGDDRLEYQGGQATFAGFVRYRKRADRR